MFSQVFSIVINPFSRKKLFLISEPANWSIYEDAKNIKRGLLGILPAEITYSPFGLRNKIIHFLSENTLLSADNFRNEKWYQRIHPTNKVIFTWFHISDNDTSRLHLIPRLNDMVEYVHTASQNTKMKLVQFGLHPNKIIVVPLGVDLKLFSPVTIAEQKLSLRKKLRIPENKFVIGSFQKDGIGWGEGLEPKIIKGPDIFCDVVEQLTMQFPVHVMLTGPARGYVIRRLEKAKIPYTHHFVKKFEDMPDFYRAIDLYLITSREEGGPKALLEALATGIPLVTTSVGMVPEVLTDNFNGFVAPVGDTLSLVQKSTKILTSAKTRQYFIKNGLVTIQKYSLDNIVKLMFTQLYQPLLKKV